MLSLSMIDFGNNTGGDYILIFFKYFSTFNGLNLKISDKYFVVAISCVCYKLQQRLTAVFPFVKNVHPSN